MSENAGIKRYKIRLTQTREAVLECFAKDEEEAKTVAAHAAEVRLCRELKWEDPDYQYKFISESPCLFVGVIPSLWAEWARDKKREGYPYKAILKGLKEHYTGRKDDVKKIIDTVWEFDEESAEQFMPDIVADAQKNGQSFDQTVKVASKILKVDQEEAKRVLDQYWIDEEHPLDGRWDYGSMESYLNFWM